MVPSCADLVHGAHRESVGGVGEARGRWSQISDSAGSCGNK